MRWISLVSCSDWWNVKTKRVRCLPWCIHVIWNLSIHYWWIAFTNVMRMVMIIIALWIRMRELMSLWNIIEKFFAILLHFKRNIDICRNKSSSWTTFRSERAWIELPFWVIIQLVLIIEDPWSLLFFGMHLCFQIFLRNQWVVDIDIDASCISAAIYLAYREAASIWAW